MTREMCIHQLFEDQVARTPEAVALIWEEKQLLYRELETRANQLAQVLCQRGVGPEVRVGICIEHGHGFDLVVALLAILKAGGAYVPLDPTYPRERLAFILNDSRVTTLLTHQHLVDKLSEYESMILCLDTEQNGIDAASTEPVQVSVKSDNLAYIIYTSGSTGRPKGVMIEHRSLTNYLCWINEHLLSDTTHYLPVVTKSTFDACLKQLFAPLLKGGTTWLLSKEVLTQPADLLKAMGTRVNVGLNCVPSLWSALLERIDANQATIPPESLTHLYLGGEQVKKDLIDRSLGIFPHLQIWNMYGPTEATANVCIGRITDKNTITFQTTVNNTQIHLLDDQLHVVPIGTPGELYVGGACVARGYVNLPELTSEYFIPNPFSDGLSDRLYKTGDRARYCPDGTIELLGRIDQQVKIRGFRIEPGEIESVLQEHPLIDSVVVIASEDTSGDARLVAYVVLKKDAVPSLSDIRRFSKERLPDYMVPAFFVVLDALPLFPNGKVDRRALSALGQTEFETTETFVAPRTHIEETLTGMWAQLLGVDRVGLDDNFFELGGHSLSATQAVSRMQDTFKMKIPLVDFFKMPRVAYWVSRIEASGWTEE